MVAVNPIRRCRAMGGFSLVELMLSLSLGLALSGVMLQGLMAEGQNGARFSRLVRERAAQRRTLELVKDDLAQATAVSETPGLEQHGCSLAGRTAVLHLRTAAGPITYSVGAAPSAIWRGQVLMRCGPAFGLDGLINKGSQPINRVVIDALPAKAANSTVCQDDLPDSLVPSGALGELSKIPFSACVKAQGSLLSLRLLQEFNTSSQHVKRITTNALAEIAD